MKKTSPQIIIPIIKTTFQTFKENKQVPFVLWEHTTISELSEKDFPDEAKKYLGKFFDIKTPIVSFTVELSDTHQKTIEDAIVKWKKHLKYFRFIYWLKCGVIINPFLGLAISNNSLIKIVNTPRGIDPDGWEPIEFQSYGITHEYLKEYRESMVLLESIENSFTRLSPFFDLTDAAFDSQYINVRLTLLVSALESLLLPGVSNEITHQLAVRTAQLSGDNIGEKKKLFKKFKEIYNLRSKYIHGEKDDISKLSILNGDEKENSTAYVLKQSFLFPIFKKIFSSEELLRKRCKKNSDNKFIEWNSYFEDLTFESRQ